MKVIEHFLGFIIDGILFPIQSLIMRLNSQRLSVVTRGWAAYGVTWKCKADCVAAKCTDPGLV